MLRAFLAAVTLLTAVLVVAPVEAHSYKLGDIAVGHIWAKPPEKGTDGVAVFAPILNSGAAAVRLVGASSPIADKARLRKVDKKDGTVTWPEAIKVQPGKPFTLAAWHEHIWLSGLHQPLKQGDWFDLTLDFGDKGKLPVKVRVETVPGH
jgi:copper(I)-binding protein